MLANKATIVTMLYFSPHSSILGSFSVIISAVYRKTVCNPKVRVVTITRQCLLVVYYNTQVHPIFVLSIVDALISLLWIIGSVVWLGGGEQRQSRVGCFTINLMTVVSMFYGVGYVF